MPDATENPTKNATDASLVVVGIGASAGGLSALKTLFGALGSDSGAAFVVIVHLPPDHESNYAELLATSATMPVHRVEQTQTLQPNEVYVVPPNHNMVVAGDQIGLEPLEGEVGRRAPIDHFFRALARIYAERAIAVVLTGSGSDGSIGLRLVKEKGGLTLAQDPSEAEFAGMPNSAIVTGQVDEVLPLKQIAVQIRDFIKNRAVVEVPTDVSALSDRDRAAFDDIIELLRSRELHDFTYYRHPTLLRRIRRRAQIYSITGLPEYYDYLQKSQGEAPRLYRDLLITFTNFFRDPQVYDKLATQVIPKLFKNRAAGEQVRVWSIGCATGEESYSLAMLLHEHAATLKTPPEIRVFATDVNQDVLAQARAGRYPSEIANDVSAERLERFFTPEEGGYRVRRDIRETIVFSRHNLLKDPPFSHLDFIVCRNVLIYFKRNMQRKIYELFHYALRPESYLLLGTSEFLEANDLFQPLDKPYRIYKRQKMSNSKPKLPSLPIRTTSSGASDQDDESTPATGVSSYGALHYKLVEKYAPPSLLVNEDYKIVYYSENIGRYLQQPGGEPTDDIFQRVLPPLRISLRAALHAAFRKQEATRLRLMPAEIKGERRDVAIWVRPTDSDAEQRFALVLFDDSKTLGESAQDDVTTEPDERTETQLESELDATKARLREVLEEYEVSQEEMRAANEELQSMNEELKSTAEELETSKEELQSSNEELMTVNQENRNKVEELSELADDLQNLLRATDIAILFLDRELKIKRFTPRAHDLFSFVWTDLGRSLEHFTHKLGNTKVAQDAREVLKRLVPIEREIRSDDHQDYLMRMLPYRTAEDQIEGVVVSFVDISELKATERELHELTAELEGRVAARTEQVRDLVSALSLAEQQERARIAQVLHDDVQQMLFALQMKLKQLEKHSPAELAERYTDATELLKQAFQMVRTLSVGINPPLLYEEGLEAALHWVSEQMNEAYGLTLSLDITLGDKAPLEEGRQLMLYHSVRELLFNIVKHADVAAASLVARIQDDSVVIEVIDNGAGFDSTSMLADSEQSREGFGLYSIRERLRLFSGTLDVVSEPGKGAVVTITMPL